MARNIAAPIVGKWMLGPELPPIRGIAPALELFRDLEPGQDFFDLGVVILLRDEFIFT